jgi:2-polyprenyl-3-methyl-5-hydroxy-6-metoxy-1,4-benzoquinol methylase
MHNCHYCQSDKLNRPCKNLNFYKCSSCGLYARYPMPSKAELNNLYSYSYSKNSISGSKIHQISPNIAHENIGNFILSNFLNKKNCKNLLDFGAGTGGLVCAIKKLDSNGRYIVEGVETSKNAREYANSSIGEECVYQKIPERVYDVITMIEVIEHLAKPWDDLIKINSILSNEGCLIITTPNLNGLNSLLARCNWREKKEPTHLIMFNKMYLSRLLYQSGFKTIEFIRFYPFSEKNIFQTIKTRALQFFGLHGGILVVAKK